MTTEQKKDRFSYVTMNRRNRPYTPLWREYINGVPSGKYCTYTFDVVAGEYNQTYYIPNETWLKDRLGPCNEDPKDVLTYPADMLKV